MNATAERTRLSKARLAEWLGRRFFLRFHFTLILAFAFLTGLLTTKIFLALGLGTPHWRWPLALLVSYLAFLLGVRIWLSYVGLDRYLKDMPFDLPDLSFSGGKSSGGGSVGDIPLPRPPLPGGGQFGGAGAGGDFAVPLADTGGSDGGIVASIGDSVGEAVGGSSDEGCLVLLAIIALLAVIFGAGIYMIWQAPMLLAEAAFEAALAAGLVKPLRRIDDPGWIGGAVRASAPPFVIVFVCAMVIAWLVETHAPEARTLVEAIRILAR